MVGPALEGSRLLLALVLCRFSLRTESLGSGAAQIRLAGCDMADISHGAAGTLDHHGLEATRVVLLDLPGGTIHPTPKPRAPKEVMTATLEAAGAFPV